MPNETRELQSLISVGPAVLRDFVLLKIRSVKELARRNPQRMHQQLNRIKGQAGYLLLGRILCGGSTGQESTSCGRTKPMVVLEPPTESAQWQKLKGEN